MLNRKKSRGGVPLPDRPSGAEAVGALGVIEHDIGRERRDCAGLCHTRKVSLSRGVPNANPSSAKTLDGLNVGQRVALRRAG